MGKKNKGPKTPEERMLEESVQVIVYDPKTKKRRQQLFKRKNLVQKRVIFTAPDGNRAIGVCWGFSDNGGLLIYNKDGNVPAPESDALWVI